MRGWKTRRKSLSSITRTAEYNRCLKMPLISNLCVPYGQRNLECRLLESAIYHVSKIRTSTDQAPDAYSCALPTQHTMVWVWARQVICNYTHNKSPNHKMFRSLHCTNRAASLTETKSGPKSEANCGCRFGAAFRTPKMQQKIVNTRLG